MDTFPFAEDHRQNTKNSANKFSFFLVFALLLAVTCAAYFPSFHSPFLVDDGELITSREQDYRHDFVTTFKKLYPIPGQLVDRPLTLYTLWLNYQAHGLDPFGYKTANILFHACAAFCLYLFLHCLFQSLQLQHKHIPLFAALCMAVHPLHTSAVDIVIQRGMMLTTLLGFLGFYFFLKFCNERKMRFYILSFLGMALTILAKPNGISFVLACISYVFIFSRSREDRKALLLYSCPMLLFFGFSVWWYLDRMNLHQTTMTPLQYLFLQTRVIFLYFKLFFFPYPLQFRYDTYEYFRSIKYAVWYAMGGHLLILMATFRLLIPSKNSVYSPDSTYRKLIGFGILNTYFALAPQSSFIPMVYPVLEYRFYTADFFLILSFLLLLQRTLRKSLFFAGVTILVIASFGVMTFSRNSAINTTAKWYYTMVFEDPKNDMLNLMTLDLLFKEKDSQRAEKLLDFLVQNTSDNTGYLLLKNLLTKAPALGLQENLALIEANKNIIETQQTKKLPFFLTAANSLITNICPLDQQDQVRHQFFFYKLNYLLKNRRREFALITSYQQSLSRLLQMYDKKSPLLPSEELMREKVLAARAILDAPKGISFAAFFSKLFDDHPNWLAFFE